MTPYFYDLGKPLLLLEEKQQILDIVNKHHSEFREYVSVRGTADGNFLWRGDDLYNLSFVKNLVDTCVLDCIPVIIRHRPKSKVIKHVDDPNKRNTVLSIPIAPSAGYAPTAFFKAMEDTKPIAISWFKDMNACLLNTQQIHGLINTSDDYRVNLQLMFNDSFETVHKLLEKDSLFTKKSSS